MKKSIRIIITLAAGFAIAIVLMSVAIYFGYSDAYAQGGLEHSVHLLGLDIYHLRLAGNEYIGQSNGPAMGKFSCLVMVVTLISEEALRRIIRRKR